MTLRNDYRTQTLLPQQPSAFLCLPISIRCRIYEFLGLIRTCPISIADEKKRWSKLRKAYLDANRSPYLSITKQQIRSWQYERCSNEKHDTEGFRLATGADCIHPNLPTDLLLVSKEINFEATQIFYKRNRFMIGPELSYLPVRAIDVLTRLEVRLTSCSCKTGHYCPGLNGYKDFHHCASCHYYCKRGTGEPLDIHNPQDHHHIQRWAIFCMRLRDRLLLRNTDDFQLSVICDCIDLQTAHEVVSPLEAFPILQHATVRLGQSCNNELRIIAENTVRRLTGTQGPAFASFLKLPIEIQEMIFMQTNLVAPDVLDWKKPVDMAHLYGETRQYGSIIPGFRLSSDAHQRCCAACTVSGEVCACPTRHAAFTSHICECWDFPRSLLLVSKRSRRLALRIFFSTNKITIWDDTWDDMYDSQRRAGANFRYLQEPKIILRQVPQEWCANLGWLRFNFMSFDSEDCLPGSACYGSWFDLTTLIKQRLRLEHLTIELDFAHCPWDRCIGLELMERYATQPYGDIIKLFKPGCDRKYKNFFVRIAFPVRCMESDRRRIHLEQELERQIMGPDYNAAVAGKFYNKKRLDESLGPKVWLQKEDIYVSYRRRYPD